MAQAHMAALSWPRAAGDTGEPDDLTWPGSAAHVGAAAPSEDACACGPASACGTGMVDVPVRADRAGRPLLLPEPGSELAQEIARQPLVTVTVAS